MSRLDETNEDLVEIDKIQAIAGRGEYQKALDMLVQPGSSVFQSSRHLELMIDLNERLDQRGDVMLCLLRLAGLNELSDQRSQKLAVLLSEFKIVNIDAMAERGLLSLLPRASIDPELLSIKVTEVLVDRYQMTAAEPKLDLSIVFHDELLLQALCLLRLNSPYIERLLVTLREVLLILTLQQQKFPAHSVSLMQSIALQNFKNEYVAFIKPSEEKPLAELKILLQQQMAQDGWKPSSSEGILLLLSMYLCLYDLGSEFRSGEFDINDWSDINDWPKSLQIVVKDTVNTRQKEEVFKRDVECLAKNDDPISTAVQQQYEENPYPRWKSVNETSLRNLSEFIFLFCPQWHSALPTNYSESKTNILIAGCGTGLHAIKTSLRFPDSRVVGIDLSRSSLAYAKMKAEELNVKNVEFFQIDILDVAKHFDGFDYIESSGVLHHMKDPRLGMHRLGELLEPQGVMKIALYNKAVRQPILEEQQRIKELGIDPSTESIREYRHSLLQRSPLPRVARTWSDFYSMSECRDLLFHVQDHNFDWLGIGKILSELNFSFMGCVESSPRLERVYQQHFPEMEGIQKVALLDRLEKEGLYRFESMYTFFCQKRESI